MSNVRSWKVGIMTSSCFTDTMSFNALRFHTQEQALAYGEDLASRWTAVTQWKVVPSEDEPNRGTPAAKEGEVENGKETTV